ncbi:hypothetical protein [Paucilactobacillus suebicus]|nr:hypothetical protein [Paucilactobacillus suebicus]
MKKLISMVSLLLLLPLTACTLQAKSTSHVKYIQNGVVAQAYGTSPVKIVRYKIGNESGSVTTKNGSYKINLPTKTNRQSVTIKTNNLTFRRSIQSKTAIGEYDQFRSIYNKLVFMNALKSGNQNYQKLPSKVSGLHKVLIDKSSLVKLNVQGNQLMSTTVVINSAALKNKTRQQQILTKIGMLSVAMGANESQVADKLQNALLNQGSSSFISNGVRFKLGYTLNSIYIYASHQ